MPSALSRPNAIGTVSILAHLYDEHYYGLPWGDMTFLSPSQRSYIADAVLNQTRQHLEAQRHQPDLTSYLIIDAFAFDIYKTFEATHDSTTLEKTLNDLTEHYKPLLEKIFSENRPFILKKINNDASDFATDDSMNGLLGAILYFSLSPEGFYNRDKSVFTFLDYSLNESVLFPLKTYENGLRSIVKGQKPQIDTRCTLEDYFYYGTAQDKIHLVSSALTTIPILHDIMRAMQEHPEQQQAYNQLFDMDAFKNYVQRS